MRLLLQFNGNRVKRTVRFADAIKVVCFPLECSFYLHVFLILILIFFLSLSDSFSSFSLFIFLSIESINCNCNLLEKYLHVNALHLSVPIDFIRSISFRFHTDNEEAKKVEETKKLRKKMHFLYYFLLFHFHSFDSLRGIFVSILKCRSMFEKKKTIATKRKY